MITLSKRLLENRFNNVDRFRRTSINEVLQLRNKIINENNKKEKFQEQRKYKTFYDSSRNFSKIDNELTNINKEKKSLELLKKRQKNVLESEIELTIKNELYKYK